MNTIVVATSNPGKIKEYQTLFPNFLVQSLKDVHYEKEIEENGTTFEENALAKAKQVSKDLGIPVIADDSGLEVDALHGRPGIFSARYAGDHNDEQNNVKLLEEMMGITDRTAQFVCVIALYFPDGKYYLSRGICKGEIVNTPKGKNGFGYDPCFYLKAYHKTMAELPMAEKNKISHRAKALNQLKELVYENFSDK
ncbi:MAG: XTP/dITP diphosphatase [Anaeroplasmataceae bacterium]|nr:XTP/dITP diphosphatase [Anaeroplasmataceae bacterium]